ncbi:MAG: GatB/YqeY domain-containing protein, partial [Candidatus Saccharimonadaceae bacterium]
LKAAILNEEVAKNQRDTGLADSEIEQLIAREVKKRRESITIYEANARQDLADNEKAELAVLEEYLPEQLSEEELKSIVKDKIAELGISGPQAMGQVIGAVKKDVGNTADGSLLAKLVKEALA